MFYFCNASLIMANGLAIVPIHHLEETN